MNLHLLLLARLPRLACDPREGGRALLVVVGVPEGERGAGGAGAAGAADAVDVRLHILGHVEVDHVSHLRKVRGESSEGGECVGQ